MGHKILRLQARKEAKWIKKFKTEKKVRGREEGR
jgi:hypothetical protein